MEIKIIKESCDGSVKLVQDENGRYYFIISEDGKEYYVGNDETPLITFSPILADEIFDCISDDDCDPNDELSMVSLQFSLMKVNKNYKAPEYLKLIKDSFNEDNDYTLNICLTYDAKDTKYWVIPFLLHQKHINYRKY